MNTSRDARSIGRLALMLLLLSASAGEAVAQPRLTVTGGDTVDWGVVGPTMVYRDVKIVNSGSDTLAVFDIAPSCGCTAAPIDRSMIPPGETATMRISMNMAGRDGRQAKTISLRSNDPGRTRATLVLRANVVRDLVISPSALPPLRGLNRDQDYEIWLAIENTGTAPLDLDAPRFVPDAGSADDTTMQLRFDTQERSTILPQEVRHLRGTVRLGGAGTLTGEVRIATSSSITPEFRLPVYCSTLTYGESQAEATHLPATDDAAGNRAR